MPIWPGNPDAKETPAFRRAFRNHAFTVTDQGITPDRHAESSEVAGGVRGPGFLHRRGWHATRSTGGYSVNAFASRFACAFSADLDQCPYVSAVSLIDECPSCRCTH